MAPIASDLERELNVLEAELKRLEAEYNMFFAGRLPRPPVETRSRVEGMVRRLDRMHISNTGTRFRFSTIQSRFAKLVELWNRTQRVREEGGAGAVSKAPPPPREKASRPADRILSVATVADPQRDDDKVRELYESLSSARREAGEDTISFPKFVDLLKTQIGSLAKDAGGEVMFRVAVEQGKVAFTARAVKAPQGEDE